MAAGNDIMTTAELVSVFTVDGQGGNPCPIVVDASGMSASEMQDVARRHGHESGFVLPPESDDFDATLRFFVPNHEMEMCGHATIGALWLLARHGKLSGDTIRISTRSGPVTGFISRNRQGEPSVEITQPAGKIVPLTASQRDDVLRALAVGPDAIGLMAPCNAVTSRIKTLIPMRSAETLNALDPAVVDVYKRQQWGRMRSA